MRPKARLLMLLLFVTLASAAFLAFRFRRPAPQSSITSEVSPVPALEPCEEAVLPRDAMYRVVPVPAAEIESLRSQLAARGGRGGFLTENDIWIPINEYPENVPFVILSPRVRTLDGSLVDAKPISHGYYARDVGYSSPGTRGERGREVCYALTDQPIPFTLAPGVVYQARSFFKDLDDPQRTMQCTTLFTTPADPAPGQVYRIEIVLMDERVERNRIAQEQAKAAAHARAVEEEAITVVITDPPAHPSGAAWVVAYGAPDANGKESPGEDACSPFILEGPNRLGGELAVIWHHLDSSGVFTMCIWAYIAHLQKRVVTLPQDADWVFDKSKTVPVRLALAAARSETLQDFTKVFFFYPDDGAQVPLFSTGKRGRPTDTPLDLDVVPGTYFAKALLKSKPQPVPLGRITFTNEPGRTYPIKLD
jgi:hypothetical protein